MKLFIYILLLLTPDADVGQALSEFRLGNDSYQNSDYSGAVAHYELALKTGCDSKELYYNLGNAYFKMNQIGRAVLNYERALKIAPNDPDVQFNLQIAGLYVVDKISTPPQFFLERIWSSITLLLNVNQWGVLSLVLYIFSVTLIIFLIFIDSFRARRIVTAVLIPFLVLFVLSMGLFLLRWRGESRNQQAIILAHKVSVLSSPSEDATEVFALHEGSKVNIGEKSGPYLKISLPDGNVGWLNAEYLEVI